MNLLNEFARKLNVLEQEVAELRAIHAQLTLQNADILQFPPRLRCEKGDGCHHEQPEPAA